MKNRPSYNSLKEDLRCANAETRGYLDSLTCARAELTQAQMRESSAAKLCATLTEQNVQLQQMCWTLAKALDTILERRTA